MKALTNGNGQPILQLTFDNGYTISLCQSWDSEVCNASVAYWYGKKRTKLTHVGGELTDNEVAEAITLVSGLPKP